MSKPLLVADWGTTSRRAWLLNDDGGVIASVEDTQGTLSIAPDGWEKAFAELKRQLGGGEPRLSLIAGMAGADRGWRDASYLPCPAEIGDLAQSLCWVEPGLVAIVPGLSITSERSDVMRGEETQLLGAVAAALVPPDCLACHPGTHTKWIIARGSRILEFRTVMTGELFALLRQHSILAGHLMDDVSAGQDFDAGFDRGFKASEPTADLFTIRADALSGARRIGNRAAYVSGLLIGADLRAGLAMAAEEIVYIIGEPRLAELYAHAIEQAGRKPAIIDGRTAVLEGLRRIAERAE